MSGPADVAMLAVNAVFGAFAVAATYVPPGGGAGVACRVLKDSRDRQLQFSGGGKPMLQGNVIEVRFSELAAPAKSGIVTITETAEVLKLLGDPTTEDPERLIWICTVG